MNKKVVLLDSHAVETNLSDNLCGSTHIFDILGSGSIFELPRLDYIAYARMHGGARYV